jgi:hypothetical protein
LADNREFDPVGQYATFASWYFLRRSRRSSVPGELDHNNVLAQ